MTSRVTAALLVTLVLAPAGGAQTVSPAPMSALNAVEHDLETAQSQLEQWGASCERLQSEANGIGPRRNDLERRARGEIRLLYHLVQGQALALEAGPEHLLEHVSRTHHVRRTLQGTLRELHDVTERASTVQADLVHAIASRAEAQQRHDAFEAQQHQLSLLDALRLPVTTAGLDPSTLASDEGAVTANPSGDPAITIYGGTAGTVRGASNTFADAAGRLLFPLAGRAEVRHAQREGAEGPGLEIAAPLGSPVRAVFAGRVAFADRFGTYGRIVIVDHGDHYYSVSANLGTMNAHVGDDVATGTVLGTVGDDGHGPMLYFEVRHGSETIDPAPWLGLQ